MLVLSVNYFFSNFPYYSFCINVQCPALLLVSQMNFKKFFHNPVNCLEYNYNIYLYIFKSYVWLFKGTKKICYKIKILDAI